MIILPDELCDALELCLGDVDELAAVINHAGQVSRLLQFNSGRRIRIFLPGKIRICLFDNQS